MTGSDSPADPPAWGKPPAGGWGGPEDPDRTQAVDRRATAPDGEATGRPSEEAAAGGDDRTTRFEPGAWRPAESERRTERVELGAVAPPHPAPGAAPQAGAYPPPPAQNWPPPQGQYGSPPPYPQAPYPQGQYPQGQYQQGPYPQGQAPYPGPYQHGGSGAPPQQGAGPGVWGPPGGGAVPPLPEPAPARRAGRSKLPLILGILAVLVVAAALVLGFVVPGFLVTKVFDATAVQKGVQQVLTDNYKIADVSAVTCGQNIKVAQGATFTCDATIAGAKKSVPVKVTSDAGDYEVGRPQ